MATDAVIVEHIEQVQLGQAERILAQFKPLPTGRNFVISAKGSVFAHNSHVTLTLQVSDIKDSVVIGFADNQGEASFSLVIGFDTPADPDFFTVAKVVGTSRPFVGGPETGIASVRNVKLVILAVDSLHIQPSSS